MYYIPISQGSFRMKEADILAAQAAGTLKPGFLYESFDANNPSLASRVFYARTNSVMTEWLDPQFTSVDNTGAVPLAIVAGKLTATFVPSADANNAITVGTDGKPFIPTSATPFITEVEDTATVDLDVVAGKITAAVKRSVDARNAIEQHTDGLYARRLAVHPDSANYVEINSLDELIIKSLAIMQKVNAMTYSSLATFVADLNAVTFVPTNAIEFSDLLFLADGQNYMYTGNGVAPYAVADFNALEGLEITESQVRAMFSAGLGVVYNPLTGIFSANISTTAYNGLGFDTTGGLVVTATSLPMDLTDDTLAAVTATNAPDALNDIYAKIRTINQTSATSALNGLTKTGNEIKQGGTLTEDTVIDQATKNYTLKNGTFTQESTWLLPQYEWNPVTGEKTRIGTDLVEVFLNQYGTFSAIVPN